MIVYHRRQKRSPRTHARALPPCPYTTVSGVAGTTTLTAVESVASAGELAVTPAVPYLIRLRHDILHSNNASVNQECLSWTSYPLTRYGQVHNLAKLLTNDSVLSANLRKCFFDNFGQSFVPICLTTCTQWVLIY